MRTVLLTLIGLFLVHPSAFAHEGHRMAALPASAERNLWQEECGACHIAYPPALLPAASWRKVMAGLERHFGSDAGLAARENQQITAFLVAHAGSRWRAFKAPMRISETAWFRDEHDELAASVWQRATVKSAANCAACHPAAERGDFEEDRVRIPR